MNSDGAYDPSSPFASTPPAPPSQFPTPNPSQAEKGIEYPAGVRRVTRIGRRTYGINTGPLPNDTDWSTISFPVLKAECDLRALSKLGRKEELIERLTNYKEDNLPEPVYIPASRKIVGKGVDHDGHQRARAWREYGDEGYQRNLVKVKAERMFILDRYDGFIDTSKIFFFLGGSSKIWQVTINEKPSCDCPAAKYQGPICKHLLYALTHVLKVPEPLRWQHAFLEEELQQIFADAPVSRVSPPQSVVGPPFVFVEPKPLEDSICPLCFWNFSDSAALTFCCVFCGHPVHRECFEVCKKLKIGFGPMKCIVCLGSWLDEGKVASYLVKEM